MSRIHPSSSSSSENKSNDPVKVSSSPKLTTLTVWKRSSMSFQGTDGFTVYDGHGRLAFRVDNYSRNYGWSCAPNDAGTTLVLMDGFGRPLLTLKPQIFSFQSQWNGCIYGKDHKGSSKDRTIFLMRRPSSTLFVFGRTRNQESQCEAEVFFSHHAEAEYRIEGSFWNRNSKIRSIARGEVAAKIIRKRTGGGSCSSTMVLSEEVFSLVVSPGFDPQLIMAFVVILDRICFKPLFTPLMCS